MVGSGIGRSKYPELFKGGITDSPLRNIDYTFKGHIIGCIGNHLHVCKDIFDLTSLIEVNTSYDLVRYVHLNALLFHKTGLGIGTIKNGLIVVGSSCVLYLSYNCIGLVVRTLKLLEGDILTALFIGPQTLLLTAFVVRDDSIGTIKYLFCGTVILFELDYLRARKALLKGKNVLEICSTESVYTLIIITNDTYVSVLSCKLVYKVELNIVCILILIYKYVFEAFLIILKYFRLSIKKFNRL